MQRPLSAGDTVDSQCTRCKALLNHTIIAMVAGEVVRVKCNTCGSEHNHRPTKAAKSPAPKAAASARSAAPRTSRAKVAGPSDEEIWEELIRPLDPDHAVPYRMDGKFKTNTLIAHPSFGTGVIAATNPGKIEVVFKCGKKLLRCA